MILKKATYCVMTLFNSVIYPEGSSVVEIIQKLSNSPLEISNISLKDAMKEVNDLDTQTWISILDTPLCYIQTSIDYPIPMLFIAGDRSTIEIDMEIEDLLKKISPISDNGIPITDDELEHFFTKHLRRFNKFNITSDDKESYLHLPSHEDRMLWMMLR